MIENLNHYKKALILLEHEEQVRDYLNGIDELKSQKQIVALSPFAMYELDKQNVPYHIPEDYYEPQELYQLGMDNYQKVEEICDIIDKKIRDANPIIARRDITPALFSFYYLKIIYDAATIRLFQLSKLIEAEKPDVILVYESEKYPFGISENAPSLLFDNRESIYAQLLALDGWKVPVVMLSSVSQPEDSYVPRENYQPISDRLKKKAVGWLQSYPDLFDLALKTQRGGGYGLFNGLKSYLHANKNMPVLLFGGGYNWDDSREELQSMGIGIIRMQDDLKRWMCDSISDEIDSSALFSAWGELREDNEFRKFFVWNNVDFFPVVEERLRFLIECLTPAGVKAYTETANILERKKIKALLASTFVTCTGHTAAQAAHNAHIPVIIWQHGGYGSTNDPSVIYSDLMNSDTHLVFGKGVVKRYEKDAERFCTKIVSVGSASLDSLNNKKKKNLNKIIKLNPEKKVVLYLTTTFYQNTLYISSPPPFSDNQLWITQRAIIDVLGKHRDNATLIKMHPSTTYRETPIRLYIKEKGFENCQIIKDECSFTDLLPLADVIIIDFPSTVLLQSLTTKKPIFALLKHLKIDDDARDLLKRRVYCYHDLEEFTKALDTFLSTGSVDVEVDLNDREFLKMYGTHLDDGKSGVRAANTLINIIKESNVDVDR